MAVVDTRHARVLGSEVPSRAVPGPCVGEYVVAISSMPLLPKLALGGLVLGIVLLFAAAIRARLRTRAYDPYTEVQR